MLLSTTTQVLLLGASALVAVNAQAMPGISELPLCVMECVIPLVPKTGCGNTDFQCFCSHQEFTDSFKTCMPRRCPEESDLQKLLDFGNNMCAGKPGYPLTRDDLNMDPSATGSHAGHSSAASPAGDMEGAAASALHGGRREAVKAVIAVVGAVVAVGAAAI